MENSQFIEWLNGELESRSWNRADLARASGISKGAISHVLNGTRNAGIDFCTGIAIALKLPLDQVMQKAGILPQEHNPHRIADKVLNYKTAELTIEQKEELINYIEFMQDRDDRRTKGNYFIEKHTRAEQNPPERAK